MAKKLHDMYQAYAMEYLWGDVWTYVWTVCELSTHVCPHPHKQIPACALPQEVATTSTMNGYLRIPSLHAADAPVLPPTSSPHLKLVSPWVGIEHLHPSLVLHASPFCPSPVLLPTPPQTFDVSPFEFTFVPIPQHFMPPLRDPCSVHLAKLPLSHLPEIPSLLTLG